MEKIKPFNAKPRKVGNSQVIHIPACYFRAGVLDPEREVCVHLYQKSKN